MLAGVAALLSGCSTPAAEVAAPPSQTAYPSTVTRPTDGTPGEGDAPPTTARAADDTAATSSPVDPCRSGGPLVATAAWVDLDGRPSLEVVPTQLLRDCGLHGIQDRAWDELLSRVPGAGTEGMQAQLTCHVLFAPTKDVWHLEPWRPVVGSTELLAARCNPGAPDPDLG